MHSKKRLCLAVGIVVGIQALSVAGGMADTSEESRDYRRATPEETRWWVEARLGMFVCWGPVSLTGKEIGWSRAGDRKGQGEGTGTTPVEEYDNLYKKWKPDKFDARQWVKVATDAGAKYMIFLVKHHDGYCLYDTKLTDYKSTAPASAWRHDVMADIAEACHEAGLKLIIYYSQPDWHHPDYFTENHHLYIKYLHGQIRELCTNYGRIDGIWFDGLGQRPEKWHPPQLFKIIRTLQPGALINNRCGVPGDFDTPEQHVGRFQNHRPWESCITLGTQWSWKPNDKIKSLKECIDILVRCAGGDGNLALNTNPMPDGRIEPRQAVRYREIGMWLGNYGESIYATRGGPYRPGPWGACTYKDKKIYLHILDWDWLCEGTALPPIDVKIVSGSLLTGGKVKVTQSDKGVVLSVPESDRRELDTIVVLKLAGPAAKVSVGKLLSSGSAAFGKKVKASSVLDDKPESDPQNAVDDDSKTYWAASKKDASPWLEIDLGEAVTVNRAIINEPLHYARGYELQYKAGNEWKTISKGNKLGEAALKFKPVTARTFRITVKRVLNNDLKIHEFQVYRAE